MAYVPSDAKWYVAEIVLEIMVEGDPRNVVHRNLVLVRADSAEEAYQKSLELGKSYEYEDVNPEDRNVRTQFRGLGKLLVIYDELEHGGELLYTEHVGVSEEQIQSWVLPKEQLGVFCPMRPTAGPDYRSKEIEEQAQALLRDKRK